MLINCHYCPHQSPNLTEAIRHFEEKHHNNGEYIVIEEVFYDRSKMP